jgi:Lon protease-like protein
MEEQQKMEISASLIQRGDIAEIVERLEQLNVELADSNSKLRLEVDELTKCVLGMVIEMNECYEVIDAQKEDIEASEQEIGALTAESQRLEDELVRSLVQSLAMMAKEKEDQKEDQEQVDQIREQMKRLVHRTKS